MVALESVSLCLLLVHKCVYIISLQLAFQTQILFCSVIAMQRSHCFIVLCTTLKLYLSAIHSVQEANSSFNVIGLLVNIKMTFCQGKQLDKYSQYNT